MISGSDESLREPQPNFPSTFHSSLMDTSNRNAAKDNAPMAPHNTGDSVFQREESSHPDLTHRSTATSILVNDLPETEDDRNEKAEKMDITGSTSARTAIRNDILLLTSVSFSLIWPWVWFGILKAKGGIQLSSNQARYILDHPQQVGAIVTLIGSLNSIAVTFLFGCAVSRYGQEFIVARAAQQIPPTVFDVSALLAFRHMSVMWGVEDLGQLFSRRRRMVTVGLLLVVLGGFALIPSGTASLVTPVKFKRKTGVIEKEVDFTSSDSSCLAWSEWIRRGNRCGWLYKHVVYLCHEDTMLDVLESGRVLAHQIYANVTPPTNLQSFSNIRFLGPSRGVLHAGPSGITQEVQDFFHKKSNEIASDKGPFGHKKTFNQTPFFEPFAQPGLLSFNYTLSQQGLLSSVSCKYDRTSPLRSTRARTSLDSSKLPVIQYGGTCDAAKGRDLELDGTAKGKAGVSNDAVNEQDEVSKDAAKEKDEVSKSFIDMPSYTIEGTKNTLISWTFIGKLDPPETLGSLRSAENITCTIWAMPEVYSVSYVSSLDYFTTNKLAKNKSNGVPQPPNGTSLHHYSMQYVLGGLGDLISWAQNEDSNLVVDSVKSLISASPHLQDHESELRLYEAIIQGVLDYKMTSQRLIYNTAPDQPKSCMRPVDGSLEYSVFGWYIDTDMGYVPAGLLLSMTLMNLATLAILLTAFRMGRFQYKYRHDPTDTRSLLTAVVEGTELRALGSNVHELGWEDGVIYMEV